MERVPGNNAVPVPLKYLPKRKGPQPDGAFSDDADADVSLGWACLASWYYDRHEGVIERCWKAYAAFKRAHGDRTVDGADVPFVRKAPYRDMQYASDEIELELAPGRYQEILDGLNVVALFLGNRWDTTPSIMARFRTAVGFPLQGRVPDGLKDCNRRDRLPAYPPRDAKTRYLPVAEFVKEIFATAPSTGGPNYDRGINPAWTKAELEAHEGEGVAAAEAEPRRDPAAARLCTVAGRAQGADGLQVALGGRALPSTRRRAGVGGCQEAPRRALGLPYGPRVARVPALEGSGCLGAVCVGPGAPQTLVPRRALRRVRPVGALQVGQVGRGSAAREAQQALPDLYTLMKRRHKLVVEADECREEARAFKAFGKTDSEAYEDARANSDYAQTYETDGTTRNVRRPASGGRSYGAGAYTTLEHDPYCTFGRQRDRVVYPGRFNESAHRTPAEAPLRTAWRMALDEKDCNYCAGDESSLPTFPEPPKPPEPSKRQQQSGDELLLTKSKKKKSGSGLPFLATASRRVLQLCRTRFRAQMTAALLGHRRRTAEAPAI